MQELAEDMLQEAFVNAFQNINSYLGKASFGLWLKKIVVNKAISHIRKQQLDVVEFDGHEKQAPSHRAGRDRLFLIPPLSIPWHLQTLLPMGLKINFLFS